MFTKHIMMRLLLLVITVSALLFIVLPKIQESAGNSLEERLQGTWINDGRNVTISFHSDNTYITVNNKKTYQGSYEIRSSTPQTVWINWEGFYGEYTCFF